jgi:hypothetical protein
MMSIGKKSFYIYKKKTFPLLQKKCKFIQDLFFLESYNLLTDKDRGI